MQKLKKIMADLFRLEEKEIDESTTLENTAAWDSLRHMELVLAVEREFGIQLEGDEIITMTSYSAIVQLLGEKGIS